MILAAGMGRRLGSAEVGVPKPLMLVGGKPLVGYALAQAEASGCTEAVVVIGYEGARVREAVEGLGSSLKICFVENREPAAPNGHSLLVAEPAVRSRFFLQMVDHLFAVPVLSKLSAQPLRGDEAARLLIDRAPIGLDLSDATRVRIDRQRISAIGKGLEPWDAIDTGVFLLTRAVFDAIHEVPASEPLTVSAAMRRLAGAGAFGAVEIDGVPWVDVDTPADRLDAEQRLREWGSPAAVAAAAPPP